MVEIGDPVRVSQWDGFWWDAYTGTRDTFVGEGAHELTYNVLTVVGSPINNRGYFILRHPTRGSILYHVLWDRVVPYTGEITVELQHRMDRERIAAGLIGGDDA